MNKKIVKTSILISLVATAWGLSSIFSHSKDMTSFTQNHELLTIHPSNQWHGNSVDKDGKFCNLEYPFNPTFGMAWRILTEGNPQKENKKQDTFKLPIETDTSFLENNEDVIIWLGHATFFIRINGVSVITDPAFFDAGLAKRKCPLPFNVNLLHKVDYILISHDHRDHLDKKSLQLLYKNNRRTEILSGLKMDEWFNDMIENPKVQTAGWYQQYKTDTAKIKIFFMPARHWSKRSLWDTNKHLWGSFIIEANGKKIFFSGDTGYGSHLKQVGELFNGIDICIIGIGAFKPEWFMSPNHISPNDAVRAANEMSAKQFIPMHYGVFDFSDEPLGEPIEVLVHEYQQQKLHSELIILSIGKHCYFNQ